MPPQHVCSSVVIAGNTEEPSNESNIMKQLELAIRQMIAISDEEMTGLLKDCYHKTFKKKALLSVPDRVANEIFFIKRGIIRVMITDVNGVEHTTHFALENQFIADYSSFLQKTPAQYSLQALEETETIVLPRPVIEWGYQNLKEGDKLGRLIAEYYFIYLDTRIINLYSQTARMRYGHITQIFPNIHNRAPQHMIASYIGITPVHLSRLKKAVSATI